MSCIPMPQKWPVGWSDCLSILTVLNACNASVEPSASHEPRLFIICYPPNFAQNLGDRFPWQEYSTGALGSFGWCRRAEPLVAGGDAGRALGRGVELVRLH